MGKSGRFGKYGEQKRKERLRQTRTVQGPVQSLGGRADAAFATGREPHPMRRISIRTAEASDVPFITSLSRTAFRQYGPYEEFLPNWFLSGIADTSLIILGKRAAGFAMLERIHRESDGPRISELLAIAVAPWARRHGLGDRLMFERVRRAKVCLVERLILHTAVDNLASQSLFRKHGFVAAKVQPNFYPEGQDALMMQKALG